MAIISKQRTKQAAIVAPVKRQSSLNELFRNLVVPAAALLIASQLVAAQTVEANPRIISGDFNSIAGPRNTAFRICVGADHPGVGLHPDNLAQLDQVHRELGFEYVRFHGIFTDDMHVYREVDGHPVYDFTRTDEIYDKILARGMKPFVELSFMPKDLASGKDSAFYWMANITPPKDMAKWSALITAFVEHLQSHFGEAEIKTWYFEVWNEPNYIGFWPKTDQAAYFNLYDATAPAIKKINPAYRVGGPATAGAGWVPDFLAHAAAKHIPVDFVSTHTYAVSQGFLDADGNADVFLSQDPGTIVTDVRNVRRQIDASPIPNLPLHITEWSASYSSRDPVHDSYTSAAFILEKLKRVEGSAASMSYWTYTDLFEEAGPPPAAFHGGFGLLTRDDIRKPSYFAYKYLNELGPDELADADASSWLTRDGNNLKLLLWNYDSLKQTEGNKAFYRKLHPPQSTSPVELHLTHVPPGKYAVELHRTGYRANDAYSTYIDMNLPKDLDPTQMKTLQGETEDRPESSTIVAVGPDGLLDQKLTLRQNDIVFLSLSKQ